MRRKPLRIAVPVLCCITAGGCAVDGAGNFFGPSGADFGATQGGAQDMGLARELIDNGQVPPLEAFVTEGMFSEHDLGLTGEPCDRTLCLRHATGIAPTLDETPGAWLQVGLSSSVDMERFQRPSLAVIACIDVSGSMGWEYVTEQTEFPSPGQVARNLLSAVAAELGAADRVAIVTYGTTVNTALPLTTGDDQVRIQAVIDQLGTGGVTDMESGLRRAYEIAGTVESEAEQVRVMLFTDIQPNVGATTATEFERIVSDGASDGVGLTVFGVGVGMRQELLTAISHLRGGNAFSLFDNEDVTELMDDDWPWLVSPIAYDLKLGLSPSEGFAGADAYGFPSGPEDEGPSLDIATVFLSKRKGALLVRFEPTFGEPMNALVVDGSLTYKTPEGETVEQSISATYEEEPDAKGRYFEQSSVGRTVALAVLVNGMADAAEQYGTNPEAAVAVMQRVEERFAADVETLGDPALDTELQLARDLLRLMEQGAPQGDLYGFGQF